MNIFLQIHTTCPTVLQTLLRTGTIFLGVLFSLYIYPQLNQKESVHGTKLGIVNKLNWDMIKKNSYLF